MQCMRDTNRVGEAHEAPSNRHNAREDSQCSISGCGVVRARVCVIAVDKPSHTRSFGRYEESNYSRTLPVSYAETTDSLALFASIFHLFFFFFFFSCTRWSYDGGNNQICSGFCIAHCAFWGVYFWYGEAATVEDRMYGPTVGAVFIGRVSGGRSGRSISPEKKVDATCSRWPLCFLLIGVLSSLFSYRSHDDASRVITML